MAAEMFKDAGKQPGLQIWRVEKMELNPIPKELYGTFFTGDSYLVLNTSPGHNYDVHTWTGSEASVDELGAGAILMMQLDDHLDGRARQYTEFQDEESTVFMSYFGSSIKYQKGGVSSGLKPVVTNIDKVERLLKIKGRRQVRAQEVELSWKSFNRGDCFIIDLGRNIYHWSGSESNFFERLQSTAVAKGIRDNERKGRAEVHRILEGEEPDVIIELLGPKPDLPAATPDTREHLSKKDKCEASLYMISDASGSMKTTQVAEKNPFKQNMLHPNECYIVDNKGNHKVYVWKGPKANMEERKAALKAAQTFISEHKYPARTQIEVLPGGAESTLFKDFFFNWMDKDETTGPGQTYTVGQIAKVEKIPFDASSLHENTAMAAQHGMFDDGSGKIQIWRVDGAAGDKIPVDPSTYGQFFGGDCYLVLYSYKDGGRPKYIIYYWQGNKCSQDELGLSALLTIQLDDSMGGQATQVRVTQGQEPPHLVSLFKGKLMIVHLGGSSRDEGQTTPGNTRLFHIRLSSTKATRAVEVEPVASSLNTNDVFVLKKCDELYRWVGKGARDEEMDAATYMAGVLGGSATNVNEKEEPESFWAALGGKAEYQTSPALQKDVRPPRLFACSNKTGRVEVEEVPPEFSQLDLATDDIMILDTWFQVYIWVGKDANAEEKKSVLKIAQEYIETDPSGRRGTPLVVCRQGQEPPSFTGWFQAWDPDMWGRNMDDLISQFRRH